MPARARMALVGAGAGAAVLVLVGLVALDTHFGQRADQSVFLGFAHPYRAHVAFLEKAIAHICDPVPFLVLSAIAVGVAFARRRPRLAVAAGMILIGAPLTTEVLKQALAHPRASWMLDALGGYVHIGPASWPSGHATAAMSLALAFVLVVPARWRPLAAALGAVFAVAVSYSFLTQGWHYPSDVLAGFLVAVTWTQLALAGLFTLEARRGGPMVAADRQALSLRAALTPPVAALLGAALLAALVAIAKPHAVITYTQDHTAFVVGAAAIAALALALATAVMLSVRRYPGSRAAASPDRR